MRDNPSMQKTHALILQRVVPSYRAAVFREITANQELSIGLVIGTSLKELKARNADDLAGIAHCQLPAMGLSLFGRVFVWHRGLIRHLRECRPQVIVCEAESHFLGYLSAIAYKIFFAPRVKLVMWCFYALPGIDRERSPLHAAVKGFARKFFSGFISYSSYGRDFLVSKGFDPERVTVAVNVCDSERYLAIDQRLSVAKERAKALLNVEGKFIVTYVGTLDPVKRPGLILDISKQLDESRFHFFIAGGGSMAECLALRVRQENISNVTLTGNIGDQLPLHYRASDVVLVPGRGGIVISEAMCFGVPVLVHQADGVERDLVIQGKTGHVLESGSAQSFSACLQRMADEAEKASEMGHAARALITHRYNSKSMADAVVSAIKCALITTKND
jgi:glycosyltransferase involved in cell wall biosynthesis